MDELAPLTATQRLIIENFYTRNFQKIGLDKTARKKIWDQFKTNRNISDFGYLKDDIPSLYHEIEKAITQGRNLQSAVFSECVYSQSLANHFGLIDFFYFPDNKKVTLEKTERKPKNSNELTVRYSYSHNTSGAILYQAGGAAGVDCAFQNNTFPEVAMIELKEPYARASDPNLPKYEKNGLLISTEKFEKANPQFKSMLDEQVSKGANIFKHLGSNINDFSQESIEKALTENYQGEKFAHVICTEDSYGNLVMIPSNHVAHWARMEGEIRPSGRNSCKAWSTSQLMEVLRQIGATEASGKVEIEMSCLKPTPQRGGTEISRYRIDPIFFIRTKDIRVSGDTASFDLKSVKQNIPSITAKMNFEKLDIEKVRDFYMRDR